MEGEKNRKFAETNLNNKSSRSHVIFRLDFEIRKPENPNKILYSQCNLIDLAGSENIAKAKTTGMNKTEGININQSLLALSKVITSLCNGAQQFIPYRDSKLTRLLQPCLGGNSKTLVICTINPGKDNIANSKDTLKFAMNAGAVKNHVKINERDVLSKINSCTKDGGSEFFKHN